MCLFILIPSGCHHTDDLNDEKDTAIDRYRSRYRYQLYSAAYYNGGWLTTILEEETPSNVVRFNLPSITVDQNDMAHISYWDHLDNGYLKYMTNLFGFWFQDIVEPSPVSFVGFYSRK